MSTFRSVYRELRPAEKEWVADIKSLAEQLHDMLLPGAVTDGSHGREFALARTKLEECVMWATKAITG